MVVLEVGPGSRIFSVHKKLLVDASDHFARYISDFILNLKSFRANGLSSILSQPPKLDGRYHFPEVSHEVFTLVFDYLYANQLPTLGDDVDLVNESKAIQLRELCQLYAFGETSKMSSSFLNKLMDDIQDGFRKCECLPE